MVNLAVFDAQTPQFYMDLALKKAWEYQLLTFPNPAVGACVVGASGEILSVCAHQKAGQAHAEVLALQEAFARLSGEREILDLQDPDQIHTFLYENHRNLFHACSIYVTLEPCNHHGKTPPCALLLERVGIKKVFISCSDESAAKGGCDRLEKAGIACETGILEQEGRDLLAPFLAWQKKEPFSFFKVAQKLNGVYQGGIISNEAARKHVHQLRSVIELLVIGGATVRADRPTLDTRLIASSHAPEVLIYSREKAFDASIPLFNIPNRQVTISDNLDKIQNSLLTMIEGGAAGFETFASLVDWVLVYVTSSMAQGSNFGCDFEGEIMHIQKFEDNYLFWIKRKISE